jgi:hypothetical protein
VAPSRADRTRRDAQGGDALSYGIEREPPVA